MYQAKYWKYKSKYIGLKSQMQCRGAKTYLIHGNGEDRSNV